MNMQQLYWRQITVIIYFHSIPLNSINWIQWNQKKIKFILFFWLKGMKVDWIVNAAPSMAPAPINGWLIMCFPSSHHSFNFLFPSIINQLN